MSNREVKAAVVSDISAKLGRSKSTIVADYRGLTVAEITDLRKSLREAGVDFRVVKNTLASRAAAESNVSELDAYLKGPTAIAFGYEDPVTPAKLLNVFAAAHKALEIKGGLVEGRLVDASGVEELAKLPSREGMLSMLLGVLQAPVRNLAYAIKQVAEQQEVQG